MQKFKTGDRVVIVDDTNNQNKQYVITRKNWKGTVVGYDPNYNEDDEINVLWDNNNRELEVCEKSIKLASKLDRVLA